MVLLGLGLSLAAGLYSSRMMTATRPAQPAAVTNSAAGSTLDMEVQVTGSTTAGNLTTRLLVRRGDAYVVSADTVEIHLMPDAKFVMGSQADLKPGAVLQVHGILESASRRLLDAQQLVILTGYVKVE
jgi:hypothetical protein